MVTTHGQRFTAQSHAMHQSYRVLESQSNKPGQQLATFFFKPRAEMTQLRSEADTRTDPAATTAGLHSGTEKMTIAKAPRGRVLPKPDQMAQWAGSHLQTVG